ncbi:BURP domain protein RD22-like [Chenopodium quinoa]|nr:BURP domain protein RD22-like [Chenopodium quinoa]
MTGVGVHTRKNGGGHTDVDVGPTNGIGVHTGKPGRGKADVNVGMEGVTVNAGHEKKPVYVRVHPGFNPFDYRYAHSHSSSSNTSSSSSNNYSSNNSDEQFQEEPGRSLFFLEKDMKFGHSMRLHFKQRTNDATFLPREKAKTLPFSTNKIIDILHEFEVEPNTEEAKVIEETIEGCKHKGIQGEQKYCATSLESLVDYAKNTLGKNVKAMSTEAKIIGNKVKNYTIAAKKIVAKDNEAAVCHKQRYAYAVFYCHKSKGTSAYKVTLISKDGSKAKAMAICHKDTSAWNPQHLAFQVLNVKRGSCPICHFLPEDHIVWISN